MKIVDKISLDELKQMAEKMFGGIVKADVDVERRVGKQQWMTSAFYIGMDLINATIEIWSARGDGRIEELLRARELFAESILTDKEDKTLEKYFMDFAIVARSGR